MKTSNQRSNDCGDIKAGLLPKSHRFAAKVTYDLNDGIMALSSFRQDAKRHLVRLNKSHKPLVLTQNGRSAAVVLAPADYRRLEYERELFRAIAEGENDIRHGRETDHDDVFRELLK